MQHVHKFGNRTRSGNNDGTAEASYAGKVVAKRTHNAKRNIRIVTTQSWFDDTEYSREGFAVGLVGLFRYGIVKPNQLQKIAMLWAYTEFSKDMPNAQRLKLKSLHSGCSVPE